MKKNLHPELHEVTAHCACGYSSPTISTDSDVRATICSHCHPFFTGATKFLDTAGRIEKFKQRYEKAEQVKVAAANAKTSAKPAAKSVEKVAEKKKTTKKK
jgi:large subunit ribosomal protein L31